MWQLSYVYKACTSTSVAFSVANSHSFINIPRSYTVALWSNIERFYDDQNFIKKYSV